MFRSEKKPTDDPLVTYQIRVKGNLPENWSEWFGDLAIETKRAPDGSNTTVLQGALADQAALRGILIKLLDLNLVLISVQQVHPLIEIQE
jgi:hypothetical protein